MRIALVYVPGAVEIAMPPVGIAYLSSFLREHGWENDTYDMNIECVSGVIADRYQQPMATLFDGMKSEMFYDASTLEDFAFYYNRNLKYLKRAFVALARSLIAGCAGPRVLEAGPMAEFFGRYAETLSRYDVVGLSVIFKEQVLAARVLIQLIRHHRAEAKIVVGGTAANDPDISAVADLVVTGDGEWPLLSYVQDPEKNRHGGRLSTERHPAGPSTVGSLDELPVPDYRQLFARHAYIAPHRVIPLAVTRGCYWSRCEFCSYGWCQPGHQCTSEYRRMSIDRLCSDVEQLAEETGTRHFYFSVDVTDPQFLRRLSEELIRRRMQVYWRAEIRAESAFVADDLLELMHRAGCRAISFGLESVVQRVLNAMNKGTKAQDSMDLVDRVSRAGMGVNVDSFIGFPSETPDEAAQTLQFILDNNDRLLLNSPGTVFYPFIKSPAVQSGKVNYMPDERKWIKQGMSFDEQERQYQIAITEMLLNQDLVRFPFRNDSVYHFLYSARHPVDDIRRGFSVRRSFLRHCRQCSEVFGLTVSYIEQLDERFELAWTAEDQAEDLLRDLSSASHRHVVLGVYRRMITKAIDSHPFPMDQTAFLHQTVKLDYCLRLSCLSQGRIPCIKPAGSWERSLPNAAWTAAMLSPASESPICIEKFDVPVGDILRGMPYGVIHRSPPTICYGIFDINGAHVTASEVAVAVLQVIVGEGRAMPVHHVFEQQPRGYSADQFRDGLLWLIGEGIVKASVSKACVGERLAGACAPPSQCGPDAVPIRGS